VMPVAHPEERHGEFRGKGERGRGEGG